MTSETDKGRKAGFTERLQPPARTANAIELTFWMLVWASIVTSASVVYFDDGARVLAASHVLVALFFAMGMSSAGFSPANSSPSSAPSRSSLSRLPQYGAIGLVATAVFFVCVPWLAHRCCSPIKTMVGDHVFESKDEAFVFGDRRMSGFLVADDQPLRGNVPMLHLADFETIGKAIWNAIRGRSIR